jgi:hypothetical protein
MLKSARSNWLALASSAFFLGAVLYLLNRDQNLGSVLDVWQKTDLLWLFVSMILMMGVFALSAWRVQIIMSADGVTSTSLFPLLRIQFISQFMAYGTPISAIADIVRAVMIKLRFDVSPGRSLRIVMYDRICGGLGAVVCGIIAAPVQAAMPFDRGLVRAEILLWSCGIAGMVILLAMGNLKLTTGVNLLDRLVMAFVTLGQILQNPYVAGELLLASLGQLLFFSAIFLALAHGMHVFVSEWTTVLFMPLIYFVSSLPIFYQGWGGREAIVIATIGSTAYTSHGEVLALSIGFGVVVFLASLPGVIFWLMRPSMRKAIRVEAERA